MCGRSVFVVKFDVYHINAVLPLVVCDLLTLMSKKPELRGYHKLNCFFALS